MIAKYAPGKCANCGEDYGEHNWLDLSCPKNDGWAETKFINKEYAREMEGGPEMKANQVKHTPKKIGCYEIHPNGLVYSNSGWRGNDKRLLTCTIDEDGYPIVRLVIDGDRKKWNFIN